MATAALQGPDIVEVIYSTKVQQIDLLGTFISGKTITDFEVDNNTIRYTIHPPVVETEGPITFTYNGGGNLVSIPAYIDFDPFVEPITNNISLEYIITIDGYVISAQDAQYLLYNPNITPSAWLVSQDDSFIEDIQGDNILVTASEPSWLSLGDDDYLFTDDDHVMVVDPYAT